LKVQIPLLFFLISIILYSCEPEIKENERTAIEGTVIDFEGNAIPNIPIKVKTQNLLLGEGSTDNIGSFKFTSLQSKFDELTINVNTEGGNSSFGTYSIIYSNKPLQQGYNLSDITLRRKATLLFNIEKTSSENNTLNWSLQYTEPFCEIYDDEETSQNTSRCYETTSLIEVLDTTNPNFESEIFSVQNTTAQFTYQLNDAEPQTILIELTEATNFYEFEY